MSLVQTQASQRAGGGPSRTPIDRILNRLALASLTTESATQLSDEVETFYLEVRWEPSPTALGMRKLLNQNFENLEYLSVVSRSLVQLLNVIDKPLLQNPQDLNFEELLQSVIRKHIDALLFIYQQTLTQGSFRAIFNSPGETVIVTESALHQLTLGIFS